MAFKVKFETVVNLLEEHDWEACARKATQALTECGPEGEWKRDQKAFLNYALCRSLSNLNKYGAALEPGQVAVCLAEDIRDWDLLGRSLIELAWAQHKVRGVEWQAVHTQRRYFDHYERYKEPARRHYLTAMLNLGEYHRVAGEHEESLVQFERAYEAAKARKEADLAETCRQNATWQALQLNRLDLARKLIKQGKEYVERHPGDDKVNAGYLIDEAQLCLLEGKYEDATAIAIEAAVRAQNIRLLFTDALDILHRVGKATGDTEGALAVAILAKANAEKEEKQNLVNDLRASIREMAIRHPEAVDRFMRDITRPR